MWVVFGGKTPETGTTIADSTRPPPPPKEKMLHKMVWMHLSLCVCLVLMDAWVWRCWCLCCELFALICFDSHVVVALRYILRYILILSWFYLDFGTTCLKHNDDRCTTTIAAAFLLLLFSCHYCSASDCCVHRWTCTTSSGRSFKVFLCVHVYVYNVCMYACMCVCVLSVSG